MSGFGITRQDETCEPSSTDAYRTHVYPFDTLPTLTSHVHPSFALLRLSRLLFDRARDPYIINLTQTNTLVAKIARLSVGWCCPQLPPRAKYDPTFLSNPAPRKEGSEEGTSELDEGELSDNESDEDLDYQSSEGDTIATPPRRIRYPPPPTYAPARTLPTAKRPSEELAEGNPVEEHDSKRRKLRKAVAPVAEVEDESTSADRDGDSESGWTKEAISTWARECSASPESPESPPPPPTTD